MSKQLPLPFVLAPHARFETYVAGPNAAAVADLRSPRREGRADTIWIWGRRGAGKSHLLQAACAAQAHGRVMYLPLAGSEPIDARVLDGLETLDLLALDDVDAQAGDPAWSLALFNLFNGIEDRGGRLLLSAARPPAGVAFGLADLASRAAAATVYQIAPLDDADLEEALKLHAVARGIELPEAAARYLLSRVRRDMTAIMALLDALDRASLVVQRKITIPLIRETLTRHSAAT